MATKFKEHHWSIWALFFAFILAIIYSYGGLIGIIYAVIVTLLKDVSEPMAKNLNEHPSIYFVCLMLFSFVGFIFLYLRYRIRSKLK